MNILLFGFTKCGKVYYGLKASEALKMNFINSNLVVEKLYTSLYHLDLSYREIVKKHGFPFFTQLEKRAIAHLAQSKNSIISLGGSLVLEQENVERLKEIGPMIFIKTSKEVLKSRLLSHEVPSHIDPRKPVESFEDFYKERAPIYEGIDAHTIETQEKTEDEVMKELVELITKLKNF